MKRQFGYACVIATLLAVAGPARGGTITGQLSNLNGTPITTDTITISVFPLDKNGTAGGVLLQQDFTGGTFTLTINNALITDPESKAIRLTFKRLGFVTRRIDGLVGNSKVTQVLDVTVPQVPPTDCCQGGICHTPCHSALGFGYGGPLSPAYTVARADDIKVGRYVRVTAPGAALMVEGRILASIKSDEILPVHQLKDGWVWTSTSVENREVKGWIRAERLEAVDAVVQLEPVDKNGRKATTVVAGSK